MAVTGAAAQTAGTEDVVAVQQTRGLVLLVAQGTHQRVDIAAGHITKAVQVGENFPCHLKAEHMNSQGKV